MATRQANPPAAPLTISAHDREVLRMLAAQVAELTTRPIEQDKRDLWYAHNALEPTRPVIFCDPENGWREIFPADQLTCEGELARGWEFGLRKEVFWGTQMGDDRPVDPYLNVPHVYTETDWGMSDTRIGGERGGAYTWDAPLRTYDDLDRLRFPEITIDEPATQRQLALAEETFGDLLTVRLKTSWWWTMGMTWTLIRLRGLSQVMYDLVDHPDELHRVMAFLRDGHMARLDYLEQSNLLSLNNDGTYVGSGGFGWTHELPQPDFDGRVRTTDMWGFAESQETVGVSPEMFAEFIFPYQLPLLERFGLTCYGCCEPINARWHIIKKVSNLRRASVSPWADCAAMAENLGDRYVYSMKPNPSDLAMDTFDDDRVRKNLRHALDTTRHCRVEVIMKDCHTIGRDLQRVIRWTRIAREEAEAL
ncbi:MAG: hypothetical protein CMJ49_05395 [Planctomycetaceae bacterium]|nr:hypothetical protein [Planctomycetaceae bacterium]